MVATKTLNGHPGNRPRATSLQRGRWRWKARSSASRRVRAPRRERRGLAHSVRSLRTSVPLASGREATVPRYSVSQFVQLDVLSRVEELFIFVAYSIFN